MAMEVGPVVDLPSRRLTIQSLLNTEENDHQHPHPLPTTLPHSPAFDSGSDFPSPPTTALSHASSVRRWTTSPDATGPSTRRPALKVGVAQRRQAAARRIASSSPSMPQRSRERREFRPTYQQEEEYFIWYHRVDLGLEWSEVKSAYTAQFPHRPHRSGFQGIQCKYYRCLDHHGVPKVRNRSRNPSRERSYGLRAYRPTVWYPWMGEPLTVKSML